MTSDGTSLYFVEGDSSTVRQVLLASGAVSTMVGAGHLCYPAACAGYQEGLGDQAIFDGPVGMAFHWPSNTLFVLDANNYVLRAVN